MTRPSLLLWRDRRGVAAVEFALVCTLLLILLGGITDYGLALLDKSRLANAVSQGVQYAYLHPTTATNSTIQTVVEHSSSLTNVAATVTGIGTCYCITGTTTPVLTAAATCATNCADGTRPGTYVIISASYSHAAILPGFSKMAGMLTISERATARIQ